MRLIIGLSLALFGTALLAGSVPAQPPASTAKPGKTTKAANKPGKPKYYFRDLRGEVGRCRRAPPRPQPGRSWRRSWLAGPSSPPSWGRPLNPRRWRRSCAAASCRASSHPGHRVADPRAQAAPAGRTAEAAGGGGAGVGVRHHHPGGQAGLRWRWRGHRRGRGGRAPARDEEAASLTRDVLAQAIKQAVDQAVAKLSHAQVQAVQREQEEAQSHMSVLVYLGRGAAPRRLLRPVASPGRRRHPRRPTLPPLQVSTQGQVAVHLRRPGGALRHRSTTPRTCRPGPGPWCG